MRSRSIKIGLGLVLTIVGFEVLFSETVTDAILQFAAAGVIPGTSIILSPNATLELLGGTLIVAGLLIFRKEIVRGIRSFAHLRIGKRQASEPATQGVAQPVPVAPDPKPVVAIKSPRKTLAIVRRGKMALTVFRHYARTRSVQLVAWVKSLKEPTVRRAAEVRDVLKRLVAYAMYYSGQAWRWLKVHVQRVRVWIRQMINRNEDVRLVVKSIRESLKIFGKWLADARTSIMRQLQKP